MTDKVTAVPGGSTDPAPGRRRTTTTGSRHAIRIALAASTAALALVATSATADAAGPTSAVKADPAAATPQRVGSAPRIPAGAVRVATPSGSTSVQLSVGLNPRDPAALRAYATDVSTKGNSAYHHYLAKGQFGSVFGPTQATIGQVTAALKAAGLHPGQVSADGLSIPVTTTLSAAGKALGTSFAGYQLKDGFQAYANVAAPTLPGDVAADVSGISGLDSLNQRTSDLASRPAHSAPAASSGSTRGNAVKPDATSGPQLCGSAADSLDETYGATDGNGFTSAALLASDYNMQHTATSGAGSTVGILELENYSASDFAAYQACYGTHVKVTTVKAGSGPTAAPNYNDNIGTESLLDMEDVSGLAPGVSIIDYEGAPTPSGWLDAFQTMVTADNAQVLSISYGSCEYNTSSSDINAENYYTEEAAAQGQTVFASSGDSGATACYPNGDTPHEYDASVNDPASQPFVTGVGGTSLPSRTVWNNSGIEDGGATGGGVSNVWSLPSSFDFQSGFTGPGFVSNCQAASGYVCRQVPDVSALADPYTGYPIYAGGAWRLEGGTSGSSPTWAALTAIANTQTGCTANGPLGYLNIELYQLARNASSYHNDFGDVTSGDNVLYAGVGYSAGTGYDLATGLGEPNAANLTSALCASLPAAAAGAGTYHPVTPTRILDTRSTKVLVPTNGVTGVQIEGNTAIPGIPSTGVTSVVLNVTVTSTTGGGVLTAWGDSTTRPKTSNLNWTGKGQTVANLVTVPVPADGAVDFFVNSSAAVIADIQGYYTDNTSGTSYTPVAPARILDTRNATGIGTKTPISNGVVSLAVANQGGVPANATAVVLNLTATGTTGSGYFAAYPEGDAWPGVSNVDWYHTGSTLAGLAVVPLGSDGNVSIKVSGTSHVIADVFGYFTAGTGAEFTGVAPTRLLDTRSTGAVQSGHEVSLQVTGRAGIPSGVKAVVLNVTVTGTTGNGFLTAWADGSTKPPTSNLDWLGANATVPNQVIVPVGADGKVDLYVNGTTQVIADAFGYYL
jgi:Pro-kumamolisin, activation domain